MELIKPKEIEVKDLDGNVHKYKISRFDAIAGREIIAQYPTANAPKVGNYQLSDELMRKALNYVSVEIEDKDVRLSTSALINQYVPDTTVLLRLEFALMEYNTNFFGNGSNSGFLNFIIKKLLAGLSGNFQTLMDSLQSSLPKDSQPTASSKKSTSKKR